MRLRYASIGGYLPFLLVIVVGTLIAAVTAKDETAINAFTDVNCKTQPRPRQIGTPDGACHQIATQNASAVSVVSFGHGCTVTVYSDEWCSFHATAVREGDCVSIGRLFKSFSVDMCVSMDNTPSPSEITTRVVPISTEAPSIASSTKAVSTTSTGGPRISATTFSQSAQTPSNALTRPEIIGLVVGCIIILLIINALLIWYLFLRKRSKTGAPWIKPWRMAPKIPDQQGMEYAGSYPIGYNGFRGAPIFELSASTSSVNESRRESPPGVPVPEVSVLDNRIKWI